VGSGAGGVGDGKGGRGKMGGCGRVSAWVSGGLSSAVSLSDEKEGAAGSQTEMVECCSGSGAHKTRGNRSRPRLTKGWKTPLTRGNTNGKLGGEVLTGKEKGQP